jgi:coatomer protein complex subunit alpha (xenin)
MAPELCPQEQAIVLRFKLRKQLNRARKQRQVQRKRKSFTYPSQTITNKFQAKKIKTACERNPTDVLEVEFDQFAEFDVCAASYTPIYGGSPSASCPFDGVKYQASYKGSLCRICEVCEIGAPASGLRLHG